MPRAPRRKPLVLGASGVLLALLAAAGAPARDADGSAALTAPSTLLQLRVGRAEVPDRLLVGPVGLRVDDSWGGTHTISSGEQVELFVSDEYAPDRAVSQAWAEFLGTLLHGPELSTVTVYLVAPAEVRAFCGGGALACYAPGDGVIVSPAQDSSPTLTAEAALAHEYGHHVAQNRLNPPWDAGEWGTKRWATTINVCARTAAGELAPGDEGAQYELNPGEGFAEAYRVLNERWLGKPESPWSVVDFSFYPDDAALTAIEQDVITPWTRATTTNVSVRAGSVRFATPLDGRVTVRRRAGTATQLRLVAPDGRVLARSRTATVRATVCGQRSLRVRATGSRSARLSFSITRP